MAARDHNQTRANRFGHIAIVAVEIALALALGMALGTGALPAAALLVCALIAVIACSPALVARIAPNEGERTDASPSAQLAEHASARNHAHEDAEAATAPIEEASLTTSLTPTDAAEDSATPNASSATLATASETASADQEQHTVTPRPTFDFEAFSQRIVGISDPIAELKLFVGEVRTREANEDDVSPFERYAARMLCEAGLFKDDVELPTIRIVRPPASGMFYLRVESLMLPYLAKVRVLALEAALNALRFSDTYFDDPDEHDVEEHYQLLQKLTHSIAAQSPNLNEGVPVIDDDMPDTEWAVRLGISTAIESFQLPHRLTANWRVNVADGNVAFELELPPEAAFPATRYVDGLGLVSTTREMRRKAASDYALRLALLVAACAFRCSERILHVWVATSAQTATRTACYLSVDFDRWRFARLDLTDLGDLTQTYRSFAPAIRYEDGILRPVEQTFELSERRFCPPWRYAPVSLSSRKIPHPSSDTLRTPSVAGLSIDEASNRAYAIANIVAHLGDTTEHNVRTIMELAGDDPDPTVRSAAERTVSKLIEGTLSEDAQSITQEFMTGDVLTQAVMRAQTHLKNRDPRAAEDLLSQVLAPLDREGLYADTAFLEHRFFPNYVDRALYNKLYALDDHAPLLVPQSYFVAHLLLSVAQLMQGKGEQALGHARRLVELSPLDAHAYTHLTRCLEMTGRSDEAIEALNHLLSVAHDPEGLGLGYYRMAYFQWEQGHTLAAQACYALAMRYLPPLSPVIAMELTALALQNPGALHEELSQEEVEQVLADQGIVVAPTAETTEALLDCARASLDAEIFPVARNFAWILAALSGDDVMVGIIRSMEDGPNGIGPSLPTES